MASQSATSAIASSLQQAIEHRDLDSLLSFYADDAELRIIDRNHPPSRPWDMHGKEEIAEHMRDVLSRDITHRVQDQVIGDDRIAFTEACEYADGMRVFASATMELRNGKIVREVELQEWDE